jgi:hypothetical protein
MCGACLSAFAGCAALGLSRRSGFDLLFQIPGVSMTSRSVFNAATASDATNMK